MRPCVTPVASDSGSRISTTLIQEGRVRKSLLSKCQRPRLGMPPQGQTKKTLRGWCGRARFDYLDALDAWVNNKEPLDGKTIRKVVSGSETLPVALPASRFAAKPVAPSLRWSG
jgi:hypothetical protein